MIVVLALGNPEPEYSGTRHNVARDVLDALEKRIVADGGEVFDWNRDKMRKAVWAKARLSAAQGGKELSLVRPDTYMNLSGECARRFIEGIDPSKELIVVHDELDLPLGSVKIVHTRGAGGHNGVRSIISHLATDIFPRVRVGIAPSDAEGRATRDPDKSGADFVLDRFKPDERPVVEASIGKAVDAVLAIACDGVVEAMNALNGSGGV